MTASHQTVRLQAGSHDGPAGGVCVMELASMLAGERFSDRPACVSPMVAALLRGYNDGLDGERRQTLKRFAAEAVGTASDDVSEHARRRMAARGIGAAIAERGPQRLLARAYVVLFPYHAARGRARVVAAGDDDLLHARVCVIFGALVAAPGRAAAVTPAAPEPPWPSPAGRSAGSPG